MSERGGAPTPTPVDARTFFRLGPHRPLATILSILVFLALAGFAFGALLGDDVDVPPFIPEEGPERVLGSAVGSVAAASALGVLGLPVFQTPTDEPSPIGDPGQQPGGEPERFGPDDAGVLLVPDGWTVRSRTEDHVTLGNGDGVRFAVRIVRVTASTPATQLLEDTVAEILAPELAAHVRESVVVELQPFGALVTRSVVGYSAIRTDAQGLSWVGGNILVYVRDDGLALIVNPEVSPPAHWDARIRDWSQIWLNVVSNFAGATPLG